MKRIFATCMATAALSLAAAAKAAVIVLTFEGVGDVQPVGAFYDGGAGGSYGISFGSSAIALVDSDSGGNGNFANEPSPNTIMYFPDANSAVLNFASGFTTGFSFFYSSNSSGVVTVFDGIDATGTALASINISAQYTDNNCAGDPRGAFCNWTPVGVTFSGTARSINFGGAEGATAYDNITFGSENPTSVPVPVPGGAALVALGLLALHRRRQARGFAAV